MKRIEVVCVTLRDGLQVPRVRLSVVQKLQVAEFQLRNLAVDRIEVASAHVPDDDAGMSAITHWAKKQDCLAKVEALGFLDGEKSIAWVHGSGGRVMNLLVKGSEEHCRRQLGCTLAEQLKRVMDVAKAAEKRRMTVNVYLEDWSQGMRQSPEFVFELAWKVCQLNVQRIMLCDTLGVLSPAETKRYVQAMRTLLPKAHLDFHGHNDYGLATANTMAAIEAGVDGVHGSINGLGERAGNAPLEEVIVAIHDHLRADGYRTGVDERRLLDISRLCAAFTRRKVAPNKPIVGDDVRTHTAGVHIDGDLKGELYVSPLRPERFGAEINHALGHLGGRASVKSNLKKLGFDLSGEALEAVIQRVGALSSNRHLSLADLLSICAEVLEQPELVSVTLSELKVTSHMGWGAYVDATVGYRGQWYTIEGQGTGGFDAFFRTLKKWADERGLVTPELIKFDPDVPTPGDPSALVATVVIWRLPSGQEFMTVGHDADQVMSGIRAAVDALNLANHNHRNSA